MILEISIALAIGILAGTFTGILPGVHINLIAVFLISFSASIQDSISPLALSVFITAMAITHSFIDFIPSIYLGAPDEDSFLSVLPGHEMLKKGLGHEAVLLTLYGSLVALIIILLFTPIFIFVLPSVQSLIAKIIPYLLIFASLYLIFREEEFILALIIFLLAGFIGYSALHLPIKEPLLPLLTGLFGASSLILSINSSKNSMPSQTITKLRNLILPKKELLKTSLSAAIAAPLCSFLPGIGSGHAAIIASEINETDTRSFLFLVGSINTIVIALSFVALYSIDKTRSGASVAIKHLLQTLSTSNLIIILITIIITGILSFFIGIQISKIFAKYLPKINYRILSILTLFFLILIIIIFSNSIGLLVFISSTALGIFAILSNTRRINLMGCLLIPTIIFYLTV